MKRLMVLTAAVLATAAFAQEDEAEVSATPQKVVGKTVAAPFMTLPQCTFAETPAEVRVPGGDWVAIEQGRHYPLGSSYRTSGGGRLEMTFGPESKAVISGEAAFGTHIATLGSQSRTLTLENGRLELNLADNLPEGAMFVTAPGFMVKNLAGESRFDYCDKGDGDEATVRCVTGTLSVEGRHFEIVSMRAANEFRIRTSRDHLMTFIYGNSGDIAMKLDQGVKEKSVVGDDGSVHAATEKAFLDWRLSPKTEVVIARALPAIGERMSVHTMAFDAAGERKSECAFCEGRAEVNSGEMIVPPKAEGAEVAKRAAEAAETTTTEAADVEDDSSDSSESAESSDSDSAE